MNDTLKVIKYQTDNDLKRVYKSLRINMENIEREIGDAIRCSELNMEKVERLKAMLDTHELLLGHKSTLIKTSQKSTELE